MIIIFVSERRELALSQWVHLYEKYFRIKKILSYNILDNMILGMFVKMKYINQLCYCQKLLLHLN